MKHDYIKYIENNTSISYDRPSFLLPSLNSPEGNTFLLFGLFLKNLSSAGYINEHNYIVNNFVEKKFADFVIPSNTGFSRNDVYGIVEFMNKFSSLDEQIIMEENDDFIITKTKKNGKDLSNNTFFKNPKLSVSLAILEEEDTKEILLQKNVYKRNILHYLSVEDAISLVNKDKTNKDKTLLSTALDIDVFDQTFFSYKINMNNFKIVCDFLSQDLQLNQDEITEILTRPDTFGLEPVDYLLKDMDKNFLSLKNLSSKIINNQSWNPLKDMNISEELTAYKAIVNNTFILLKHDLYVGEKLHNSLFNEKSPLYKEIGIYFEKAIKAIQDTINKTSTHPSFQEFLNTVNELRLIKTIEAFDEKNQQLKETKSERLKRKI
jgi:hypothetical protein